MSDYIQIKDSSGSWVAYTDHADITQISVVDGLGAMDDTMTLPMLQPIDGISPLGGQAVRLVVGDVKLFEGIIPTVGDEWYSSGIALQRPVSCNSYAALLAKKHVTKEFGDQSAGARIRGILDEAGDVFANDKSNIESGPDVPEETYDYVSVASAINKVAQSVGYMWYLDFDGAIHFFADLDRDAPITAIDCDTNLVVGDIKISRDASNIVNVVILKDFSSKVGNKYNHGGTGDGYTNFFGLPMPPFSLEDTDVYVKPEGGSSWNQYDLAEDPLDGDSGNITGQPGMAYLCIFNWGVRFPSNATPGPGDQVKVSYNPEEPDRVVVVFDEDSIAEFAAREGTNGRHEMVVSVSDFHVEDDSPVIALGNLILRRKAWPVISGSFTLRTTNYGEWKPGQVFTITSDKRDIFDEKSWVESNYVDKDPIKVWITRVNRRFEINNGSITEFDTINFSSQPWE